MKEFYKKHVHGAKLLAFGGMFFAGLAIFIAGAGYYLSDKIINTQIMDKYMGVYTKQAAIDEISKIKLPKEIVINIKNQEFLISTKIFNLEIDAILTTQKAFFETRNIDALFKKTNIDPVFVYDSDMLDEQISLIAGQVYVAPVYPDISFEAGVPLVTSGVLGYKLNNNLLFSEILNSLAKSTENKLSINFKLENIGVVLGTNSEDNINNDYDLLKDKQIYLTHEGFSFELNGEDLLKLHHNIDGTKEGPFTNLLSELIQIEREAQNPVFKEENGKVTEFSPSKNGIKVREEKLKSELKSAINNLINTNNLDVLEIIIPIISTEPEIKTGSINDYGIRELIGKGSSTFKGSIPSRVHNVALAAEKMNGTLIAPGEVFSFNNTIGDISVFTGFKQSFIIKDNQTVLGDGGGVCQVSTTMFRAALNTGLEIVERNPHSYRVGYYEQGSPVGIDATIYTPTIDFKFKNNTENYILIQTVIDVPNRKLDFEFYGTSDGREITIGKPSVTDVTEPPEDLYTDDPTKPVGFIEQVDYKAWGAKVNFDYKVVKDGKVLQEKTFYTNYRAWQAKFIRGTGPAI